MKADGEGERAIPRTNAQARGGRTGKHAANRAHERRIMGKKRDKQKYVTYDEAGSVLPHVDTAVRQRSRYGGVGVTAGDDLADFFADPDEPPSIEEIAIPNADTDAFAVSEGFDPDEPDLPAAGDALEAGQAEAVSEDRVERSAQASFENHEAETPTAAPAESASDEAVEEMLAESASDEAAETAPTESESGETAASEASQPSDDARYSKFAQFKNVYESRDKRLCVFEDEFGHLVAVDARRLA